MKRGQIYFCGTDASLDLPHLLVHKTFTEDFQMIARIWHGKVPANEAQAYFAFLLRSGVPDYKATPGNRGVHVFRRTEGEVAHFLLTTFWDSYEAIQKFAGEEVEPARYYPEDVSFLLEFEPTVVHYEVLTIPETATS